MNDRHRHALRRVACVGGAELTDPQGRTIWLWHAMPCMCTLGRWWAGTHPTTPQRLGRWSLQLCTLQADEWTRSRAVTMATFTNSLAFPVPHDSR
jgi:hypothetical protein